YGSGKINVNAVKDPLALAIIPGIFQGNPDDQRQDDVEEAKAIDRLQEGDEVLISEGCTHHRQCEDIGTVKLPAWIEKHIGFRPKFTFTSGGDFTDTPGKYALIIHCGGCTLPEREMQNRLDIASSAGIPIVNYGIAIAHMNGILERSLSVFRIFS
ncbi:MAG: [FeFe] hydrogenase H-cluster maturation GTPase HydF, partial [Lachnospiraceae bacterium]|nr:[FeFe] hydrogenase H-cluster maturation GTPase HydF [Lachnospiraceae bacterium]